MKWGEPLNCVCPSFFPRPLTLCTLGAQSFLDESRRLFSDKNQISLSLSFVYEGKQITLLKLKGKDLQKVKLSPLKIRGKATGTI